MRESAIECDLTIPSNVKSAHVVEIMTHHFYAENQLGIPAELIPTNQPEYDSTASYVTDMADRYETVYRETSTNIKIQRTFKFISALALTRTGIPRPAGDAGSRTRLSPLGRIPIYSNMSLCVRVKFRHQALLRSTKGCAQRTLSRAWCLE